MAVQWNTGILLHAAVVTQEFPERPFAFDMAARIEIAFDDVFGIGRHADVTGDAFHHVKRRAAQARDETELVDRHAHRCRDHVDGMRAHGERDRQLLAARRMRFIDRAQIAGADEIDAGLVLAAQHQPADADIGHAGLAVAHIIDRSGDIRRAIEPVGKMHRQRGEIDLIAREHDFLHRRVGARDLDQLGLVLEALDHFGHELARLDAEGQRHARTAAHDIAHELGFFGSRGFEPDRLVVLEFGGEIGEIDRLLAQFAFAGLDQQIEETPQPEPVAVIGTIIRARGAQIR